MMKKYYLVTTLLMLCFAMSGCVAIDAARLMYGNELASHSWHTTDKHTKVEFESLNQHTIVTASINGVDNLRMVLDTGAAATVIFETEKTQSFLEQLDRKIPIGGIGEGKNAYGYFLHDTQLTLGEVSISGLTSIFIKAQDNPMFALPEVTYIDGVIGYDLFSRFVTAIDFTEQTVSISESKTPHTAGYQHLPLEIKGNLPYVNISVEGTAKSADIPVLLDTGGIGSLKLAANSALPESKFLFNANATGIGGKSPVSINRFTIATVGQFEIPNVVAALSQEASSMNIMGTGIINRFNLVVDYPSNQLFISPNHDFDKINYVDSFGATLLPHTQGAYINAIQYRNSALLSEIQVGDILTEVNGEQITRSNFDAIYNKIAQPAMIQQYCYQRNNTTVCNTSEP